VAHVAALEAVVVIADRAGDGAALLHRQVVAPQLRQLGDVAVDLRVGVK
jgi:hypothetical protein